MKSGPLDLPFYIISNHVLAGQYLVRILQQNGFARPTLCERLPVSSECSVTMFILDNISLPLPLGACITRLCDLFARTRFIVIDKPQTDDNLIELLRLGTHGFVDSTKIEEELPRAAQCVVEGNFWISNQALQRYVETHAHSRKRFVNISAMTPREAEILEFLKRRLSNKEIANLLGIQESTVKYHVSNVFAKLQVGSRHELENKDAVSVWERLTKHTGALNRQLPLSISGRRGA